MQSAHMSSRDRLMTTPPDPAPAVVRVLLVDSNHDTVAVYRTIIEYCLPEWYERAVEVFPAFNTDEALVLLRESGPFDVITVRRNTHWGAADFLRQVRAGRTEGERGTPSCVPILMYSASHEPTGIGETVFLASPIEPRRLVAELCRLLRITPRAGTP